MMNTALKYLAINLATLPAICKEKRPAVSWKEYQDRLPTAQEWQRWSGYDGLCIICGAVSGNLFMLDFDQRAKAYLDWAAKVSPDSLARCVIERSQRGGLHVIARSESPVGKNEKLALDANGAVLIETRDEGGLFLCAPTPGYELTQGDFKSIPVLTAGEVSLLLDAARSLNEKVAKKKPTPSSPIYTPPLRTSHDSPDAVERCRNCVENLPPCIKDQGGDNQLFHVACVIFHAFALDEAAGWPILEAFNSRCLPPWDESRLRYKMSEALAPSGKDKPRGWRLYESPTPHTATTKTANATNQNVNESKEGRKSRLIPNRMSEHDARAPRWLWEGRIALGEVTLLNGSPGAGKTTFITHLCAVVSSGGVFADGTQCAKSGCVLYLSSETSRDVFWAGLTASSGDLGNVIVAEKLGGENEYGETDERLLRFHDVDELDLFIAERPEIVAIIFDPVGSFLAGGTDAHRDNAVRDELNPIDELAEKHGIAIIGVTHPSKSGRHCTHADESVLGSTGFVGIARAVWHLVTHPEKTADGDLQRILASGKMNNAKPAGVLRFRIVGVPVMAPKSGDTLTGLCVVTLPSEEDDADKNANDIFRELRRATAGLEASRRGPAPDVREKAEAWLEEALSQDGVPFVAATELHDRWKAEDGSERTLGRAKASLGVRHRQVTIGGKTFSVWHLPSVIVGKDGTATGTFIAATDTVSEPPSENDMF